jgi:hypothetical protein
MYPVLPMESMVGGIQFVCYFLTVLTAVFGVMLFRQ